MYRKQPFPEGQAACADYPAVGGGVLPIGSNNDTMPNLNRACFWQPLYTLDAGEIYQADERRKPEVFPATAIMSVMVAGMVLIQGMGFHSHLPSATAFMVKKGMQNWKIPILKGMKTRSLNAEQQLTGLLGYAGQNGLSGRPLITFGNAPGLHSFWICRRDSPMPGRIWTPIRQNR